MVRRPPDIMAAREGLPVSTPTAAHHPSSSGPDASQNAPVDAPNAPPSPTESGPAAESLLSPKRTSTQLGSALESGSRPKQTEPSPTATAGDPSGDDVNYDPGYTDNDNLCETCHCLLEPDLELEGWEVKVEQSSPSNYRRKVTSKDTTILTWSGNLKNSLFNDKCPLCRELLCGFDNEVISRYSTHKFGAIKSLGSSWWGRHFVVLLEVLDKQEKWSRPSQTSVNLYPERENGFVKSDGQSNEYCPSKQVTGNPGPFGSNTGSDLSWQIASSWMAKCLSSHQRCTQSQCAAPPLPTRVIDVGSVGELCSPRLNVVTENTSGRYATLSHRWASQGMLKLEVNNFKEFQREIPWKCLPKTYQNAIEATRRLGIRYIWIDSLCIIQDSPDGKDWVAESAKMTSVYENSHINFAAADAVDSTQGCFFDRDPSSIRPLRLHINWEHSSGYYYAAGSHRFAYNVASAPLYRRGWVYQERTLAPRIIHCCAKQLYWECLESIASESFPKGLPHCIECTAGWRDCDCNKWQRIRHPESDMNKYLLDGSSPSFKKYFDSLILWNRVVFQYQALDLTFESDKLVAISGLARMHSRFLNTQYLAGLWLEHLPIQLLWYRDPVADPDTRSYNEYIAPSWSYASFRGPIQPPDILGRDLFRKKPDQSHRPIIQILDATIALVDEKNPFGAVSGGALRISGPLANISLIKNCGFSGITATCRMVITYPKRMNMVGDCYMDRMRYDRQMETKQKPIYLLPVMLDMSFRLGWGQAHVSGLMLEETTDEYTFRRVGVFEVRRPKDKIGRFRIPRARQKEDACGVQMLQEACRSQNGLDEDGEFPEWGKFRTITLV
ncbi:heterokaryon incompatibility protein-domain-containing protein [Neurospora hispaniola]|uniref:Heterokaryon incompatibility protein-domain-containing protein n=1 Tax=Neurospora hispaniola TaxID=588809 RepID=A0AAJ0IHA7_9PEZI|nr:heterokaryon incompatibility protein-domain-containing protein [Neurospora hispaniola]